MAQEPLHDVLVLPEPNEKDFVPVKTTLPKQPLPPNTARQPVHTDRLTIRVLTKEDLHDLHVLRTQPEVMQWTALKKVDDDLEETMARLSPFLEPNDARTYNFAICERETGEFIGLGGFHNMRQSFGWPELGYMFKKAAWGKGYATEFLEAFLGMWEGLEREEVEIRVDPRTIVLKEEGKEGRAKEQILAITSVYNGKSQRVLEKCGFERVFFWDAPNLADETGEKREMLPLYTYFPKV
ncbi:GNAT domain-containing protein [Podospora australis]|uniref:GNAT domain-containing protein n=1 Tax=Podospora australis TaxID=1536484 RepID=A0AAN6X3Q1_9PEZI|nr:GNAT domain-containing protein [Podospora australis]